MSPSIQKLLASMVDYAGLFPPAAVTMETAVENYIQYRQSPFSWMLGRFLLPISRWSEFESILQQHQNNPQVPPNILDWPIHLIVPRDYHLEQLKVDMRQLAGAKKECGVKAIELPPISLDNQLSDAIAATPKTIDCFIEVSLNENTDTSLTAIKNVGGLAKVRTGGLTSESFPDSQTLAEFLIKAARLQIPFKATAGLHHLFPAWHPLPSPKAQTRVKMQGFLNLAIAAAIARYFPVTPEQLVSILEQPSAHTFRFIEDELHIWGEQQPEIQLYTLSLKELTDSRTVFFRGFGSCSFESPITELQEAKLC